MAEMTFLCEEKDFGVIAEPVPANRIIEEWFRKLPVDLPYYNTMKNFGHTVKACPPFLDAMTLGWIMLTPVDAKIEVTNNGAEFTASWRFPGAYIEAHWSDHMKGHPKDNRAIIKLWTMWTIQTPPGWSTLVFPPLNRGELPWEALSAMIDTDRLHTSLTIPAFLQLPEGIHLIKKGTPIAQVIPVKRQPIEVTIRAATDEEEHTKMKQERLTLSETGFYRAKIRAKDRDG